MINCNSICLFIVLSLKYFMYNAIWRMQCELYVVYVSMYFDMFYSLWPAGQIGSMEFEINLNLNYVSDNSELVYYMLVSFACCCNLCRCLVTVVML
jgi:hypothetical protein